MGVFQQRVTPRRKIRGSSSMSPIQEVIHNCAHLTRHPNGVVEAPTEPATVADFALLKFLHEKVERVWDPDRVEVPGLDYFLHVAFHAAQDMQVHLATDHTEELGDTSLQEIAELCMRGLATEIFWTGYLFGTEAITGAATFHSMTEAKSEGE
jgi:hypothetical protein